MPDEYQSTSRSTLSALERYHILRDQLQHEDNLTTQRLSWLMASQAFLFSGYGIVLNGPELALTPFIVTQRSWLLTAIPALAVSSTALIYISIIAGVVALFNLHGLTRRICTLEMDTAAFPPIQGSNKTRIAGLASPLLVPPIFLGVWLLLMVRGLVR
ncbi:MAG: hypothetical protein JWL90_1917 [Chthoniobacteraceae bacterium]|nr:hypothetical protein [Chthoniobacteraceae bacterium]